MADPKSEDAVARESTRLHCAAVNGAQTTLDPRPLLEWMPNYRYGAHAFGLKNITQLRDKREQLLKWIQQYSPMSHVSADDPLVVASGRCADRTGNTDNTRTIVGGVRTCVQARSKG